MNKIKTVAAGTWVEISRLVLPPGARAPQVPADTATVPLQLRVKGFLQEDSVLGQEASVLTLADRLQKGILIDDNPRHVHDFGEPVPELLSIGRELRQILQGAQNENE